MTHLRFVKDIDGTGFFVLEINGEVVDRQPFKEGLDDPIEFEINDWLEQ